MDPIQEDDENEGLFGKCSVIYLDFELSILSQRSCLSGDSNVMWLFT